MNDGALPKAPSKCCYLASSDALARAMEFDLSSLAGKRVGVAANLGIDTHYVRRGPRSKRAGVCKE
eukprot:11154875-Lingulodinium_polyedra.AAC.1